MDLERGLFVVWWIERFCKLYEGEHAGQPMRLRGCHQCHTDEPIPNDFNDAAIEQYMARAERHNACYHAGHFLDWQFECVVRLFGWVRYSEKWKREIRRFRQASIWVAKKNKKSPTLAAIGLYLLCGDGEPGQKVFLGAKDGQQARDVAGKHAIEMLSQSPELMEECSINKNLMQITHEPTRSIMRPMSSSNSRTQESKEGINGSVLIDETHVVDREFVGRISRAGISRSEPLQLEVSTAGDNPDGYGKERFDYASNVLDGTFENQDLFVAIYAAPQDLSDSDLASDPVKYGRMANPAMGHTVDEEEYLKDYNQSKVNIREFGNFKKYRLDIWQRSSSPWIHSSDWQQCESPYTEEDLIPYECYAGLDLSKTQDMSSLSLVFNCEDEIKRCLTWFWLPEEVARERADVVPYLQWAKDGWLELTPGNVIDYGYIKSRFRKLVERFTVLGLYYDKTYAEELTQSIEQGTIDEAGREIEKGTGIERIVFPQTLMYYSPICKEYERLILSKQFLHHGNPILTWQMGHVQVRSDVNQNIRPVKPPHGDNKKIDGVMATLMGLAGWVNNPVQRSVYESRGLSFL